MSLICEEFEKGISNQCEEWNCLNAGKMDGFCIFNLYRGI